MHIHFIAIGGAAMHNLALALHENGNQITGSDDEIKEPSYSRLNSAGLLPETIGWDPSKLESKPDVVILGMHARADNPELVKAMELGLNVMSFPEFLYQHSKNKLRVVIGGSHGKTTITSMVMHVLREAGKEFDYMVGSTIQGFTTMVKLTDTAPIIVLEGDEYLSSPIDRRPKFHLYKADIGLISGIAWDHINVFPTFENYVDQFRIFANEIPETGTLVCFDNDEHLTEIAEENNSNKTVISYGVPQFSIQEGLTTIDFEGKPYQVSVFGRHNLANLEGARVVCELLGVQGSDFYRFAGTFKGAGRRMELVKADSFRSIYRDFAHSPSKLGATIAAVKEQFPNKKVIACFELHTFSSLNDSFLQQYASTMDSADVPIVYFNPEVIAHKKLKPITVDQVKSAFGCNLLDVHMHPSTLKDKITSEFVDGSVLLMMSSGSFDGVNIAALME